MDNLYLELSIIFGLTASTAVIIRFLRQPLMVAYIISGIIAGPIFLNLLSGNESAYHAFADFGIVLLLFVVGLGLNFKTLKEIGRVSFLAGVGQAVFTASLGTILLLGLGFELSAAFILALATTFSSTIIIVKLLSDKNHLESVYGRYTVGLMVVQDLIAIALMFFLSTRFGSGQSITIMFIKTIGVLGFLFLVSKYILPKILKKIAKSTEFLFLFTIAWCFGVAALVSGAGLSLELGAILAGLSLGSSPWQREIMARVRPLRDFFLIIFFIILGSELAISGAAGMLVPSLIMSLFILIGNPLILYLIFRSQKFTRRNSFLSGLTAAQVSEFGFVLLIAAEKAGLTNGELLPIFTIIAILTIFGSSYLINYNERIFAIFDQIVKKFFGNDRVRQIEKTEENHEVWIFGCHRLGRAVVDSLIKNGLRPAIVDFNPENIEAIQKLGLPAFYGDAGDLEFIEELPLGGAKLVISSIPHENEADTLIKALRTRLPNAFIIAVAQSESGREDLKKLGADLAINPHTLGGRLLGDELSEKKLTPKTLAELKKVLDY